MKDYVVVHGKKINIKIVPKLGPLGKEEGSFATLHISPSNGIKLSDIGDIEGFSELTHLKVLNLSLNYIKEICKLEQLTGLESLDLSFNELWNINGLDSLVNLKRLDIKSNLIEKVSSL